MDPRQAKHQHRSTFLHNASYVGMLHPSHILRSPALVAVAHVSVHPHGYAERDSKI
jgi:hypothetical protein